MPHVHFDDKDIAVSLAGFAIYDHLCACTDDALERHDALLDLLFNEGLLCDVCANRLTVQTLRFSDVRLCRDCAAQEPPPLWWIEEA